MSVTLLQIMEQVGSRNTSRIAKYVNDGLKEIAGLIPDKTDRSTIDIEEDTRLYNLPGNLIKLTGVFEKIDDDNDKYARISNIQSVDIIQDGDASSTSSEDDLIII